MSVIVHSNENIDKALRRLYREVVREGLFDEVRDRMYFISKSSLEVIKRNEWRKMKRRHRTARRRATNT